jgi:hypothetical protein
MLCADDAHLSDAPMLRTSAEILLTRVRPSDSLYLIINSLVNLRNIANRGRDSRSRLLKQGMSLESNVVVVGTNEYLQK